MLKVVCCSCRAVIREGDEDEPVSHGYCKTCAAAQMRQLDIWDITEKMEREGAPCHS